MRYNRRHIGSIPDSGRSPREVNGNPPQYSCLQNPIDREAWQATVHLVAKCQTQLSAHTNTHTHTHKHSFTHTCKTAHYLDIISTKLCVNNYHLNYFRI